VNGNLRLPKERSIPETRSRERKEHLMSEVRRQGQHRPVPLFRRPIIRGATIAVGVAVVALVVLSVVNVFGSGGPSIVKKAEAALAVPVNTLIHFRTDGSQDNGDGTTATWSDETWLSNAAQSALRRIEVTSSSAPAETALSEAGLYQLYDPDTNTVYQRQAAAGSEEAKIAQSLVSEGGEFQQFKNDALKLVQSPDAKVEEHVDFNGRDATRITSADGRVVYFVDPKSSDPLGWQTIGDGGGTIMRISYEKLPVTAENLKLVDLIKQHAGAKIDTDPAHYDKALGKLFPNG
jgi:hypothetical protein